MRELAHARTGPAPEESASSSTPEAFGAWVQPHWAAMSRLALRLSNATDWEDVLQDALSLAWRKRHQFDPHRGTARNWLLALTADQAAKARRKRLRQPNLFALEPEGHGAPTDVYVDLDRAVADLTDRQRLAIELYYFIDLPVDEVAVAMSCSVGTIKSTLADARAKLRATLGANR